MQDLCELGICKKWSRSTFVEEFRKCLTFSNIAVAYVVFGTILSYFGPFSHPRFGIFSVSRLATLMEMDRPGRLLVLKTWNS